MTDTNITEFAQAKKQAQKDSQETLFEKAYDLGQRIALLKNPSCGINQVFDTLVYSVVAITDNTGVYVELEKSHGGVKTSKQDIQEPIFGYKSAIRDSLDAEIEEEADTLECLLEEAKEMTDVNGKKFLVQNPSVQHIFHYRSGPKGEVIRYSQMLDGEEVFQANLLTDGTARITNYGIQEGGDTIDPMTKEEIDDFFYEMNEWVNENL